MSSEAPSTGDAAGPDPAPDTASQTAPAEQTSSLRSLSPRAVPLWRLAAGFRSGLLIIAAVTLELLFDLPIPSGSGVLGVAVAAVFYLVLVPPLRYRAWRFALRETDLYLRHGVLFRTTSIVPHARIQHVDTRHGPIDRWLGLAGVVVFTAGTRGAIMAIPALDAEDAEALRDRLAALSGAGDAV